MILTDLLQRTVRGADGELLGHVRDVRLVLDGPVEGPLAAPRLHGLVVHGRRRHGVLGDRRVHTGLPWPLGAWFHRGGDDVLVLWEDVAGLGPDGVRLRPGARRLSAELPPGGVPRGAGPRGG